MTIARNQTFRVAIRQFGPFEEAIQQQWQAFATSSATDLTLDAVSLDLSGLVDELLVRDGLRDGNWDVAFLSSDWFSQLHEQQAVVDLAPLIAANPPDDYPGGWAESLIKPQQLGSGILGLPYHDGPECLIYRSDLFEHPDERRVYEERHGMPLAPPRSWAEFHQIARHFHRPDQGLYGTTFAAFPDQHNTVFDFCLQLWSRGGELTDQEGNLRLNTPEAIAALTFYRAIMTDETAIHPRSREFDSVAAGQAIADGEVALTINWFGFATVAAAHPSSSVRGKIDIAAVPAISPAGISLNSYWILAIAAGSPHIETAYRFLRHCASPAMDLLLTQTGGIGCRTSTWTDPGLNQEIPFYHRLAPLHQVARMLPQRADWPSIAETIETAVLAAVDTVEPIPDLVARLDRG